MSHRGTLEISVPFCLAAFCSFRIWTNIFEFEINICHQWRSARESLAVCLSSAVTEALQRSVEQHFGHVALQSSHSIVLHAFSISNHFRPLISG